MLRCVTLAEPMLMNRLALDADDLMHAHSRRHHQGYGEQRGRLMGPLADLVGVGCVVAIDAGREFEKHDQTVELVAGEGARQLARAAAGKAHAIPWIRLEKIARAQPATESAQGGRATPQRCGGQAPLLLCLYEGDEAFAINSYGLCTGP